MMERLKHKLTYANVMATIAVFGVLAGGGAYAASKIGAGDIARDAVHSEHIKNKQVKGPDVDERTLDPTCPRGFKRAGRDVCYDGEHAAAAQFTAAVSCAEKGARLPSLAEAVVLLGALPAPAVNHITWTDDGTSNDTAVLLSINPFGAYAISRAETLGDNHAFRCVTEPRG